MSGEGYGEPRHQFGDNPGEDTVHESTRIWNELKVQIQAREKQAMYELKQRHIRERDELANAFRDEYVAAAKKAGFRQ